LPSDNVINNVSKLKNSLGTVWNLPSNRNKDNENYRVKNNLGTVWNLPSNRNKDNENYRVKNSLGTEYLSYKMWDIL